MSASPSASRASTVRRCSGVYSPGGRELGKNRDNAARGPEFKFLPTLKTRLSADDRRNDERRFIVVFNGDSHNSDTETIKFTPQR
jgi:hypothetical protein